MPARRKAAAELDATGAFRHDPGRARVDAVPAGLIGDPPAHLNGEEIAVWNELVSSAPEGTLTRADRIMLEMATVLLERFRFDRFGNEGITTEQFGKLMTLLSKIGATPQDRSRVTPVAKIEKDDGLGEFL